MKISDKITQYWPALLVLIVVIVIATANNEPTPLNMAITYAEPGTEHLKEGTDEWEKAEEGSFSEDENIRTSENARAALGDGKNVSIKILENSTILLDEYSNTSFKVQQGNGTALYEARDNGTYEIEALAHNIFFKKGKVVISVNKEAKRIHIKALKGDFQTIFNDASGSSELILETGYQITFDPAREEAINKDKIDDAYDAESIWENWTKSESIDEEVEEDGLAKESDSDQNSNVPSDPASSSAPAAVTANCQPSLTAERDGKLKGIKLKWSQCISDDFQVYKLLRANDNKIPEYNSSPVIVSLNNSTHNNYFDQLIKAYETYTYRVCTLQRVNRVTCSNPVTIDY